MAKLKTLAGAPANFPLTIETQDLAGNDVEITFTAIGRTLRDWHPIYIKRVTDEANASIENAEKAQADAEAAAGKAKRKAKPVAFNEAEVQNNMEKALQTAVGLVREVACGWELDDEFTDDAIKDLISKYPGIQQVAHQKYHDAISGNRAKN